MFSIDTSNYNEFTKKSGHLHEGLMKKLGLPFELGSVWDTHGVKQLLKQENDRELAAFKCLVLIHFLVNKNVPGT